MVQGRRNKCLPIPFQRETVQEKGTPLLACLNARENTPTKLANQRERRRRCECEPKAALTLPAPLSIALSVSYIRFSLSHHDPLEVRPLGKMPLCYWSIFG